MLTICEQLCRVWKEKMRCDGERYEELSKKHQERCKKWWEKLTPEQRREKRKQYNMKWRQNQKKSDDDPSHSKVIEDWHPYKSFSEVMMENQTGPKPTPEYYPKSNNFFLLQMFLNYLKFLCFYVQMQDTKSLSKKNHFIETIGFCPTSRMVIVNLSYVLHSSFNPKKLLCLYSLCEPKKFCIIRFG